MTTPAALLLAAERAVTDEARYALRDSAREIDRLRAEVEAARASAASMQDAWTALHEWLDAQGAPALPHAQARVEALMEGLRARLAVAERVVEAASERLRAYNHAPQMSGAVAPSWAALRDALAEWEAGKARAAETRR